MGELDMITDGDAEQVEGNNVELGRGVQWVQIDLERPNEIYGVLFWHYHQPRVYLSVIVRTADDEGFTKNVQTWFNNDTNNKAGLGAGKNLNYMETYEALNRMRRANSRTLVDFRQLKSTFRELGSF